MADESARTVSPGEPRPDLTTVDGDLAGPGAPPRTAPVHSAPAYTPGPTHVGPYRVLGVLGEGGMGVVYLAEQDAPVQREVALKVLRAGLPTAEVVARFERERQALALMEHPNITHVYDAGATAEGLPYFAMERVAGVPITEHADARALTVRERVRLFGQVCAAVQHAHQKGIVHRDLKPSNVLVAEVDGRAVVKVIDFGIAKAVAPEPGGAALTLTGVAVGTPAYMSPEQFADAGGTAGADVDTRADIYALGVMLYELLAGALPYDAVGWALIAQRASGEVPLPSARYAAFDAVGRAERARARRTDAAALRHALTGDLDAVIAKALEHDRERRYATAGDLAHDLESYLRDEPVAAARATTAYRLRKFVRRHRTSVAFGVAAAALLVALAATSAVQARRLAAAQRATVARQAQAEELVGFMLGDLRDRLTPIGRLDVLDAVGDKALAYFASVPERELSSGELARRAQALVQVGQVRMDQGDAPAALALFRQAVRIGAPLAARDPANAAWQLGLAHAHFWAGSAEWQQGNREAAEAEFAPLVAVSTQLLARYPDSTSFRRELAYALSNLGSAREARGDLAGALGAYQEVLALRRALVARDSADAELRAELALAYDALGVAHRKAGPLAAAVADHTAELALAGAALAADPADRDRRRAVANARAFRSYARLAAGDADGALADARVARDGFAALVARDSSNALWRTDLAALENAVAAQRADRGEAKSARRGAESAAALLESLARSEAPSQRALRVLVLARTTRARALAALDRPAEAAVDAGGAAAAGDTLVARKPRDLDHRRAAGDAYLVLGDVRAAAGDDPGAAAARTHALALVDSAATATGQTELLALRAAALLDLGRRTAAHPTVAELDRRGYRPPGREAHQRRPDAGAPP